MPPPAAARGRASRAARKPPRSRSAAARRPPATAAPTPSRSSSRARSPTLVQKELERMILAGDLPAGGKLNEDVRRRAARRLARAGARGVSRARGVGPRPAGEEPRRVRPPDERRRGRRDLRGARGARRVRRPPRRADRDRRARPRPARARRTDGACRGARATSTPTAAANLEFHDRLVELAGNAKLLADLPAARQRAPPLPARDARAVRARCRSRRASTARSSTGSPPGRPPPPAARCSST